MKYDFFVRKNEENFQLWVHEWKINITRDIWPQYEFLSFSVASKKSSSSGQSGGAMVTNKNETQGNVTTNAKGKNLKWRWLLNG